MGLSNLTSSIVAGSNIVISNLKRIETTNLVVTNATISNIGGTNMSAVNASITNASINSLAVPGGTFSVGVADTRAGIMNVYGDGNAIGGRINLFSGANFDATINGFSLLIGDDDLRIGPFGNASALKYRGMDNYWVFGAPVIVASGTLDVGQMWTRNGVVNIHGAGGQDIEGGKLRLYNATTFKPHSAIYFDFAVVGSNLEIGPSVQTDSLVYNGDNQFWQFKEGLVQIGVENDIVGQIILHSDDDDTGGEIQLHAGQGFGAVDYFKMYVEEASFHMKAVGGDDLDILEYEAQNRSLNFYVRDIIDFQNATALLVGRGLGYVNFGGAAASAGYGFRDLNGTVQFKHEGGAWANLA